MPYDKNKIRVPMLLILFLLLLPAQVACAAKSDTALPPYRTSGVIPGTSLSYEGLFIDKNGHVTITIQNEGQSGLSFSANFGFYTNKGDYVTGFTVSGFANRKSRTVYELDLPNYKNFKKASYMKVLGRAGRTSG